MSTDTVPWPLHIALPTGPHEVEAKSGLFREIKPINNLIGQGCVVPSLATKTYQWTATDVERLEATGIQYGVSVPASMILSDCDVLAKFIGQFPNPSWVETEGPYMTDFHFWRALKDLDSLERMRARRLEGTPERPSLGETITSGDWLAHFNRFAKAVARVRTILGDRSLYIENLPSTAYCETGHEAWKDADGNYALFFDPSSCMTLEALDNLCRKAGALPVVDISHNVMTNHHLSRSSIFGAWHERCPEPTEPGVCGERMLSIAGCYIDGNGYLVKRQEVNHPASHLCPDYVHIEPLEDARWAAGRVPLGHKTFQSVAEAERAMNAAFQMTGCRSGVLILLEASSPFHHKAGTLVEQSRRSLEFVGQWLEKQM